MKTLILTCAKAVLAAIYAALKLFPVKGGKVIMLSRQTNEPSLDFRLLMDELKRMDARIEIVCICNRIEKTPTSLLSYGVDSLRSMYHLATSRVCVLDSYWPVVSVLNHKQDLTVVQIWHATGKVKKSGLITVGKRGGRSSDVARIMRMHANYDYIIAGAPAWNQFYCDSFGCEESAIRNFGLPRLDYLSSDRAKRAEEVYARCPELRGKKVVLYAPTFRRGRDKDHSDLFAALASEGYTLVVKAHPNQPIEAPGILTYPELSTMELLFVTDLIITDFSAIALEAAAANVRTLYYLYDYEEYIGDAGLNIDIPAIMPGAVFYDAESLADAVRRAFNGDYPVERFEEYRKKFLLEELGHSTNDIANLVIEHAGLSER